jgi:hypothetical protein
MAHYAFLDENNIVIQVIIGKNENEEEINWEEHYGSFSNKLCKRTSYNTQEGIHLLGGVPFRKNYAGIGYTYDESRDAFIPPKPFNSWILNEDTCNWEAPVARHLDGKNYKWNEETLSWDLNNSQIGV